MTTHSMIEASTPIAPSTLVEYQPDAIVSRTLLKRSGGTVTVFAFDAGQALSEHTAPFDAVAHVLDGEMLVMPAHQPHAVHARTRMKLMLTMIRST